MAAEIVVSSSDGLVYAFGWQDKRMWRSDPAANSRLWPTARGGPLRVGQPNGLCLVVAGAALPSLLSLPRWVESELVLGAWWTVWTTALAVALYKGWRLGDDYRFVKPELFGSSSAATTSSSPEWSVTRGCADPSGCGDPGCDGELRPVLRHRAGDRRLRRGVAAGQLVLPIIVFLAYTSISRALIHVANARHECAGNLPRAIAWGALWAAAYVAPLTLVDDESLRDQSSLGAVANFPAPLARGSCRGGSRCPACLSRSAAGLDGRVDRAHPDSCGHDVPVRLHFALGRAPS